MKKLSALALALPLLGGSMLLGAGAANAAQCQAGYHWNDMGNGAGWCAQDASGGGTGGSITYTDKPVTVPVPQAPDFPTPAPYIPKTYAPAPIPAPPIVVPPAPAQAKVPAQHPVAPVRVVPPAVVPAQGNAAPAVTGSKVPAQEAAVAPANEPVATPAASPSQSSVPTSASPSATPSSTTAAPVAPSPSESSAPTEMKFGQASSAGKIDPRSVAVVVWFGGGLLVAAGAYLFIRIAGKRKASEN